MAFIALVDDHVMLRQGLASLINASGAYKVLFEADNGKDFIAQLKPKALPDVVLMDITMPEMDGYETTSWLRVNHPGVKVLALSMMDDENAIIRMLKCGAKGFIVKNSKPAELYFAIGEILTRGYYYNELVTNRLAHSMTKIDEAGDLSKVLKLTDREIEFLKWACTEKNYKEIGEEMYVSPRTVESYRDTLFQKLGVKTRIGLAIYAIKNGVVRL